MALTDPTSQTFFKNKAYGDEIKGMSAGRATAAAKGPDAATIRQATAEGAAQAGAVGQAGAMEAAQGLMGAGTGAVSPGRAQALMAQSQAGAQEGAAQAGKGARDALEMIAQRKYESSMATLQQQQQFDRQMALQTLQTVLGPVGDVAAGMVSGVATGKAISAAMGG
tara:strand:+ start:1175 stop:1675 length:501 start_codon:yes stop_codon:yes gene_type:complete